MNPSVKLSMFRTAVIYLLFFSSCLQTKKLSFDFKNNPLFGIGFAVLSDANSKYTLGGSFKGFSSGSLILTLNGTDETFAPSSNYTFSQKFSSGTAYTVTVKTNPTGYVCSISNGSGKVGSSNIVNIDTVCATASVSALYSSSGSNWNDYVKNDGADIFSASGTECTGSETGTVTNGGITYSGYRLCLHGGEMRKAEISSRSSCTGLTASDSLSALNWVCRTDSSGKVFFYSTGLKQGKYLSDLIDWNTNGWRSIRLTVLDGSTTLMTTLESSSWWGNGLDASNGQNANTSGKIYLYSAIPVGNIRVNTADKVAAVFKPGLLHNSNGGACSGEVILVSGVKFTWIEGYINVLDGTSAIGLNLQNVKFSAVKNFSVQNAGRTCSTGSYYGLSVSNTVNSHFEDIISANTQGTGTIQGMFLSGSSGNTFLNILTMNNEGVGISFASSSNRNVFINALSVSDGSFGAFESSSSTDTVLMNFTSANSSGNGINTSQTNAFLSNLAIVNSATSLTANSAVNLKFQNTVSVHNASNDLNISAASSASVYFTGTLKVSGTCNASGPGQPGIVTATCAKASPSDFDTSGGNPAVASVTSSSTFSGSSNNIVDSSNSSFSSSAFIVCSSVTDWVRFSRKYRGIGRLGGGSNFPGASSRGTGTGAANCSLWDFSLKNTDTVLRNANPCPSSFSNPLISHSFSSVSAAVLRNSVEIIGDGIGNDNGLCEANEDCIYTPNIGAYQGHGNLVKSSTLTGGCADVTSLGIKLYQYETNGY